MTTDEQDALEDRLNNEGKYTAFISDKVSLHGDYTAEDLIGILKFLSTIGEK